jgi:serine/threonine-protein kinase
LRRYDEAERYVDRAMALVPNMPSAYISKADIAIHRDGDLESARSYLREAVRLTPPERRCYLMGYVEQWTFRVAFDSPCDWVDMVNLSDCLAMSENESAADIIIRVQCSVEEGRNEEAMVLLDSARVIIEHAMEESERPSPWNHISLAYVYAHLGRAEDAIREGKRSLEIMPVSKDAFDGPEYLACLAEIYAIVGDYEAAIDQLEILFSVPSLISGNALRLDPTWDPLRDHPRFQKLLDEVEGSGS